MTRVLKTMAVVGGLAACATREVPVRQASLYDRLGGRPARSASVAPRSTQSGPLTIRCWHKRLVSKTSS